MIPRIKFANLPTPIEPMQKLSAFLNGPRLWIKRDDLTGLALGGNKARKLEFLLAEALANGAHTLITMGGAQSNHCRQTAALAARYGLRCILVLSGYEPPEYSGNLLLDKLFEAQIHWSGANDPNVVMQELFDSEWSMGHRPYSIPMGGSNPIGGAGYFYAIEEMIQQNMVVPDWIIVASASGGTQAGLILGTGAKGLKTKVLGISINPQIADIKERIISIAEGTADRIKVKINTSIENVLIDSNYNHAGYAVLGDREIEAIKLFAKHEGLLLGPVYTARAAAGMIDLIKKGVFKEDEHVLFWHTGDNPTLFAREYSQRIK